ncbi:hypothetical protein IGX41_04790 [Bacillus velezensis]|uniref:reverse transcriptase domain-containing protein n=1 Tax=Bacillus TaxID=1386 RepID=UPI00057FAE73|nr:MULTISPECIES: reverse transcriptase domain-containing protein [Bacillus]AJC25501.1 hypothetical protein SB24_10220 [Bacillus sp. Pc3]MBD8887067.1 hypothetical protein [Bacillus velezensis]PHQ06436.1 hypothetical protein CJ031_10160 [Bacillus velezensis]QQY05428.1 hypothetical protein JKJ03_18820 [Bacillus velezensis]UOI90533.1 hypothetical protein LXM91_19175 [Bacillus amyloliquefaciens]
MRERIIKEISNIYGEDPAYILQIINSYDHITPFILKKVKGKEVIDKYSISLEEQIVLDYYKILLNVNYNIKFPNRSYIMTELMNLLPYLHFYKYYTIYKFDFKKFFNNVSPAHSYKLLSSSTTLRLKELRFFEKYTKELDCYRPGIGLHNSLIEICGMRFDQEVKSKFKNRGLLYYSRYVDDCIIILDETSKRTDLEKIILKIMKKHFGKKLELNDDKTAFHSTNHTNYAFSYLGYCFQKGQSWKSKYKIGIDEEKLKKHVSKLNTIILEYGQTGNIELLSFRLELFFKRIVFFGDRNNDGNYRWQVRGISDSYKELKRFMHKTNFDKQITRDTLKLFKEEITNCFKKNNIEIPPKINNQIKNNKFISCFKNNKAFLIHPKLGLNKEDLINHLSKFNEKNIESLSYNELARLLLVKIK